MSFNLKLFFTFVIFGIFLALFSVYSFSKIAYEKELLNKTKVSNMMIIKKEMMISKSIENLDNHLFSLSQNKTFQKYIKNKKNENFIESLFETIILSDPTILQIKYTNTKEIDTITHSSSHIKSVEKFIPTKIDKDIFHQIKETKINTIWHSKIGVNIIKGENLNFVQPLYIIGVNVGSGVLRFYIKVDAIISSIYNKNYKLFLLDKDANIIIDSKKELSWEKYRESKIDLSILLNDKNFDFSRIMTQKTDKYIAIKIKENNKDEAILVLVYPDFGTIIDKEMYYVYISILLSTILLGIILAFIFSRPMSKMTNKIERLNNQLDKKVEQRTKKLKESLRVIDQYVIRTVTDTDGTLLSVSDAFCKVSQYSKSELIGENQSIIRHPDMPRELFIDMWNSIKSGKTWKGKIKNLAKDKSYYWVESYIEPNFIKNKIISYTAIQIKISNKVKLEELNKSLEKRIKDEVQKNTEQLKRIQQDQLANVKLSSIGALAAGITHEINTPLTYIKGNFELLKYDIEDLPKSNLRDNILLDTDTISDGINRISNIIEAMKEVSSSSSESIENVNIYNTLITALRLSFNNAKQISRIYLNDELFDISNNKDTLVFNALAQKQRIEQLWIIIINNALDELVKVEDYEVRKLDIKIKKINNKIVVDFVDNAGGISNDIIDKIFEPFVSTKKSGGMGIGLNIAKKIVDEHCGIIRAINYCNGAQFRIELYIEGAKC
ncbi:ATP-binding protein [Arcobacteraceae bacterium]|nr:ATP-binding protein [Arcobacteraceae bacterium]